MVYSGSVTNTSLENANGHLKTGVLHPDMMEPVKQKASRQAEWFMREMPAENASYDADLDRSTVFLNSVSQNSLCVRIFGSNDSVWLYEPAPPSGIPAKFPRARKGPYTIEQALTDVTYRLVHPGKPSWSTEVHVNRLKSANMISNSAVDSALLRGGLCNVPTDVKLRAIVNYNLFCLLSEAAMVTRLENEDTPEYHSEEIDSPPQRLTPFVCLYVCTPHSAAVTPLPCVFCGLQNELIYLCSCASLWTVGENYQLTDTSN
ncbi:hypothetical protein CLF_101667 [Clonorchis sinensis]|uniref:Integrase p58-like C-terminal domain-containing protein n=1 Tax=Clonorchis sinensis TaxID=79923 RepID=G7Y698_CLOSI|nr:hypothetical protein CLF_101667 [Clonorchis sinensis]